MSQPQIAPKAVVPGPPHFRVCLISAEEGLQSTMKRTAAWLASCNVHVLDTDILPQHPQHQQHLVFDTQLAADLNIYFTTKQLAEWETENRAQMGGGRCSALVLELAEASSSPPQSSAHESSSSQAAAAAAAVDTFLRLKISGCILSLKMGLSPAEEARVSVLLVPHSELSLADFRNCNIDLAFAVLAPPSSKEEYALECEMMALEASILEPSLINEPRQQEMLQRAHLNDDSTTLAETAAVLAEYSRELINEKSLFHVVPITATHTRTLAEICSYARVDLRQQSSGRFGRGISLFDHPIDGVITTDEGRARRPVAVVCCRAALGKVHPYPTGVYEPSLFVEPTGSQSIRGSMRFGEGYVTYRERATLVTHVALCSSRIPPHIIQRVSGELTAPAAPAPPALPVQVSLSTTAPAVVPASVDPLSSSAPVQPLPSTPAAQVIVPTSGALAPVFPTPSTASSFSLSDAAAAAAAATAAVRVWSFKVHVPEPGCAEAQCTVEGCWCRTSILTPAFATP